MLQIICDRDLLDILYLHCDFVLMFEMNKSLSLFLLEAEGFRIGQTVVHYRHTFTSGQVCFSLVGLVQVYIACVRPTKGFIVENYG